VPHAATSERSTNSRVDNGMKQDLAEQTKTAVVLVRVDSSRSGKCESLAWIVRRRAELYYRQFDALVILRQQVRQDLLTESRKHGAMKWLRQIPSIGPIRAALLIALIQTPHRFGTKRQLWAYSGLALKTYSSGEYRFVEGQLQRSKRLLAIRGLNTNHNHDLKNIFKGAAIRAAVVAGPFQEFYAALVARGMKPSMARLTLARKIAAITLLVWKKGVRFDAEHLKQQAA
jgi:transposase